MIGTFMWSAPVKFRLRRLDDARVILSSLIISGYTMVIAFEILARPCEPLGSRWPAIIVLGAHSALFLLRVPFALCDCRTSGSGSILGNGWSLIIAMESLLYAIAFAVIVVAMGRSAGAEAKEVRALRFADRTPTAAPFSTRPSNGSIPGENRRTPGSRFSSSISTASQRINDRFGHAVGDKVLRLFAEKATANLRPAGPVGRLGGEEFAVISFRCRAIDGVHDGEQIRIAFAAASRLVDGHRVWPRPRPVSRCSTLGSGRRQPARACRSGALCRQSTGQDRVEIAEVDRPRAWRPAEAKEE